MDITPKQFVTALSTLRWKLGRIVSHLRSLDEHINSIADNSRTAYDDWKANPPKVRAEFHEPDDIARRREASETRREQREIDAADRDSRRLRMEAIAAITATVVALGTIVSVLIARRAALSAEKSASASEAQAKAAVVQANLLKRSVEASIDQFHIDQRAWVSVKDPYIYIDERPTYSQIIAKAKTVNNGRTPALGVSYLTTVDDTHTPQTIEELMRHPPTPTTKGSSSSLAPGAILIMDLTSPTMPPRLLPEVMSKKRWIYMFGVINYVDIFSNRHSTHFCVFYIDNSGGAADCPFGNSMN